MVKHMMKRLIFSVVILLLIMALLFYIFWFVNIEQYSTNPRLWDYTGFVTDKFLEYLANLLQGDFGTYMGEDVKVIVFERAHYTMKICIASLLFFVVFGVILGIVAAVYKNRWIDKLITGFTTIFSSIPSFIIVWFLMLFLGWRLKWVPPIYPVGTENPIEALLGLVIPVLSLSLWPLAKFTHMVRSELVDEINSDAMLLPLSKGMTKRQAILKHLVRNSIVVVLPEISISFVFVLASSFIVEIIYNMNGMANLFMDSMLIPFMDRYYVYITIPVTMVITTFYIAFGMVISLIVDLCQVSLDPRIRLGSKKTY